MKSGNLPVIQLKNEDSKEITPGPRATLLIGGDFCPLRHYEEKLLQGKPILTERLGQLFHSHDFTLINLEAPLCAPDLPTLSPGGFGLRCDPAIARSLKDMGIHAAGLANNHILDYRAKGLFQTVEALEKNSIRHAGAGRNLEEAERPLEITLNGLRIGIWILAEKELNCAGSDTPGSSFFSPDRNLPRIGEMRKKYDFLILYVHAGHEFTDTPSPRIRSAFRSFIHAGADLVIGHHPHVIQGMEAYEGGWIAYSLGNLLFDSDYVSACRNTEYSFMLSMTVRKHALERLEAIPCKMLKHYQADRLDGEEAEQVSSDFIRYSSVLADDSLHSRAWERNIRKRWQEEYHPIFRNFSFNFFNPENPDYALRTGNLFTCPTHLEMLQEICRMFQEGKLKREK
ncbi:MAG: Capsule biosynthesis protein CapA [Lentisphaerae bacterium ADurb.Bin242]|nr:MAG: Capsule biosynthesis protein CapA [Lentisphaerae bacterium ADurb.Bin242]